MASEQDALRAWVQSRKSTPWSKGFSEDFMLGYDTAVWEVEAALAAAPAAPEIDVERLARAIEAAGCEPSCGDCGAAIDYHADCDEGDGALVWETNPAIIAAAYSRQEPVDE